MAAIITTPLSLCKVIVIVSLKTFFLVAHTWADLVKGAIILHLSMFRTVMIWMVALILLPIRIFTALTRERQLEEYLHEMRIELEALMWERKELEGQLRLVMKERKILESMLAEVEEENDMAVTRIELLEGKLQDLKLKNLQLKETVSKRHQSFKDHDDPNSGQHPPDEYQLPYGTQSRKYGYKKSGILIQEVTMRKTVCEGEGEGKTKSESVNVLRTESATSEPINPFAHGIISENLDSNEVLERRRDAALSQSLFSALLSLLVGMIIWEAEDPCIPLVVALFIVVGMSLRSVVQFFSTIKNRPATDAVALLSFNWFILGTLTYPTLPRVTRMLAPLAL